MVNNCYTSVSSLSLKRCFVDNLTNMHESVNPSEKLYFWLIIANASSLYLKDILLIILQVCMIVIIRDLSFML